MDLPDLWLGMTNWPVTFVYFLPTQQLNQPGPKIADVRFCQSRVRRRVGLVQLRRRLGRRRAEDLLVGLEPRDRLLGGERPVPLAMREGWR